MLGLTDKSLLSSLHNMTLSSLRVLTNQSPTILKSRRWVLSIANLRLESCLISELLMKRRQIYLKTFHHEMPLVTVSNHICHSTSPTDNRCSCRLLSDAHAFQRLIPGCRHRMAPCNSSQILQRQAAGSIHVFCQENEETKFTSGQKMTNTQSYEVKYNSQSGRKESHQTHIYSRLKQLYWQTFPPSWPTVKVAAGRLLYSRRMQLHDFDA